MALNPQMLLAASLCRIQVLGCHWIHLRLRSFSRFENMGETTKAKEARMTRREFLKTGSAGVMALGAANTRLFAAEEEKPLRVGLIGSGWYGKTDLLHLMQVAPVEVVG